MPDSPILPLKCDVAKLLLDRGSLFVHLDPRMSDVFVPPWLRHQAQLVLQVGFDMPIPIPDLRVDDAGVFGTLSFSRHPFTCGIPWESIFALVGDEGRGMVWPESMPPEIVAEVEREEERRMANIEPPTPIRQGIGTGSLADLAAGKSTSGTHKAPPPPPRSPAPPPSSRRRALPPYMRVIK
jgi:hypothetical protein